MVAVGFLFAGPNSDLYGRRITLMVGEAGLAVGLIICASAKTATQFQAGMGISGFFAGVCYMILCSIPYDNKIFIFRG
jgi:MFS family permease